MSFISPIPTDANGNPRTADSMQSLGKDDFLELLVAKLEHQDPMDPQSDEDFIAQLAQFSSLEQMNNIADGIDEMNNLSYLQMQSQNNMLASGLIGSEVTADYSGVFFDKDSEPSISFTTDVFAKEIDFVIKDETGNIVRTITREDVSPGSDKIEWDGKDSLGNVVAEGYYSVEATATDASGNKFTPDLSLVGIVTKISYRDGAAFLMVNGNEIAMGDIVSIGTPEDQP